MMAPMSGAAPLWPSVMFGIATPALRIAAPSASAGICSGTTRVRWSLPSTMALICENYYKAIRTAPPYQIEALDMARKALHDEGATELQKRFEGKIETDFDTARRLFTLLCVLQMRG